jgi:hypothetical protein
MDIIYILREVKLCNALSILSQLPDANVLHMLALADRPSSSGGKEPGAKTASSCPQICPRFFCLGFSTARTRVSLPIEMDCTACSHSRRGSALPKACPAQRDGSEKIRVRNERRTFYPPSFFPLCAD